MADWWQTGWNTPSPTGQPTASGGYTGGGQGIGGILGVPTEYLGNIGWGLLAGSGPSLAPQGGFGSRLGRAGMYADERRDQGLMNETRRMALSQASDQRAAEAAFQAAIAAGDPAGIKAAAGKAYPEVYAKSLFPQPLDPVDQVRLAEIYQSIKEKGAASSTPSGATARAVGTLSKVFDTAEKESNPFAPGEFFSSQGVLAKAGLNSPEVAKGLPDYMLSPFGDPATIRRQAGQAILIDKETQTITQNLTQLADKGTGRSATAINNLNTSMGVGNVPIPVRRNAILGALETVIDDVEARGETVEPEWYTLRAELREKTKDITSGGAAGNAAYNQGGQNNTAVAQPPPSTVITPQAGVPNRTPPAVAASAGPAAPGARAVTTLPLNAQGIPTFNRKIDLERAEKAGKLKGVTAIELNGKTYDRVPE